MSCLLRPVLRQRPPACQSCRKIPPSLPWVAVYDNARIGDRLASTNSGTRGRDQQAVPAKPSTLFKKLFPNVASGAGGTDVETDGVATTPFPDGESISLRPIRQHKVKPKPASTTRLRSLSDRGKLWLEKRKERLDTDDLRAWLESQVEEEEGLQAEVSAKTPVVLIMFNASKSLTESDFHRLVRQNPHLEGWNSQLEKVVQAYDRNGLEPLGCYFLHFNSVTAARKFQLEAQQLHYQKPSDTVDPYSMPSLSLTASPETPLRLKMYALQPHTIARLNGFTLDGIMEAAADAAASKDGRPSRTPPPKAGESHRAILSLDHGAVELSTLQDILRRDGEYRNLAWDVTSIIPYHASRAKKSWPTTAKTKKLARKGREDPQTPPEEAFPPSKVAEGALSRDAWDAGLTPDSPAPEVPQTKSGRFVLSFGDEAEARRFARMWHRRELQQLPVDAADSARPAITVNVMIPL